MKQTKNILVSLISLILIIFVFFFSCKEPNSEMVTAVQKSKNSNGVSSSLETNSEDQPYTITAYSESYENGNVIQLDITRSSDGVVSIVKTELVPNSSIGHRIYFLDEATSTGNSSSFSITVPNNGKKYYFIPFQNPSDAVEAPTVTKCFQCGCCQGSTNTGENCELNVSSNYKSCDPKSGCSSCGIDEVPCSGGSGGGRIHGVYIEADSIGDVTIN